jgi:hypothetical protein
VLPVMILVSQGLRCYTVGARSQASGELAGLTELAVDPAIPTWGLQELTAVAPPYRGLSAARSRQES